ncbi:MAG: aspartate 1-decarboxylase [Elusimicrobiota bacterium]|jgi:aspartate 1-decarboxylase
MRMFLRSKIHNAVVTEANLRYVGSITIDEALMRKADIREYERVLVVNNTNGNRVETYAILGRKGSGVICANGAASHLIRKGHEVIIMTFEGTDRPRKPRIVLVDKKNRFVGYYSKAKPQGRAGG